MTDAEPHNHLQNTDAPVKQNKRKRSHHNMSESKRARGIVPAFHRIHPQDIFPIEIWVLILNFLVDCPFSLVSAIRATKLFYTISKGLIKAATKRAIEYYLPENRRSHADVLMAYARRWLQMPLGPCYEVFNTGQCCYCVDCVMVFLREPMGAWTSIRCRKCVGRSETNVALILSGSRTDLIVGFSLCDSSDKVTGPSQFAVQSFSAVPSCSQKRINARPSYTVLKAAATYIYCGEFKEYNRHGIGIMRSTDGSLHYEGEWNNDEPEGVGCLLDMRRSMLYIGMMSDLSLDGCGISYPLVGGIASNSFEHGYFFGVDCLRDTRKSSNSALFQILNRVKHMTDRLGLIADKIGLERSVFADALCDVNNYFLGINLTLEDRAI